MKLFGDFDRTYTDYKDEDESHYSFLNRTARPEFAAARQVLEEWFAAYPQAHRKTFISNFTSDKYGPHSGSFFELYCYTLLRAQGSEVLVEQVINTSKGNTIDFVVRSMKRPDFCVESTVIADAELTVASQRQLEKLKQRLNSIKSNRRLILDVGAASRQELPIKEIAVDIAQWLRALDAKGAPSPDPESEPETPPSYTWAGNNWSLLFRILPGERVSDLVPMQYEDGWIGTPSRLKKALEKKADQHPNLGMPYIVAVDVFGIGAIFRATEAIADDLFGQTVMIVNRDTGKLDAVKRASEFPGRPDREMGFWLGQSGPRNRHVSGVLAVNEVVPWSVMKQTPVLWHNPWAQYPLSTEVWQGPHMALDKATGEYQRRDGKTIQELLGNGR